MHVKTVHDPGVPRPGRPHVDSASSHKQEIFKCRECGKEFLRFYDMNRHRLTHSNNRPHKCARCGRSFARADALMRHQRPENGCHRRFMEEVEAAQNRVILKASGQLSAQRPGLIGPEFVPIITATSQPQSSSVGSSSVIVQPPAISPSVPLTPGPPSNALPPPRAPSAAAAPTIPSPNNPPPPPPTNAWQIIQDLTSRLNILEMRISQQDSRIAYLEYNQQKQSQIGVPAPSDPLRGGLGHLGDPSATRQ